MRNMSVAEEARYRCLYLMCKYMETEHISVDWEDYKEKVYLFIDRFWDDMEKKYGETRLNEYKHEANNKDILQLDTLPESSIKFLYQKIMEDKKLLCADTLMILDTRNREEWRYHSSSCCIVGATIAKYNKVLSVCTGYKKKDIDVLDEVMKLNLTTKYLDVETMKCKQKKTAAKYKHKDDELHICSNSKKKFNYISALMNIPLIPTSSERKAIPGDIRLRVWREYNQGLDGKCYVCEDDLYFGNFHVSHVIPVCKGGSDRISNLRPCCQGCNLGMGSTNLEEYKKKYYK